MDRLTASPEYAIIARSIEDALEVVISKAKLDGAHSLLIDAMRHCLAGGKRLRPVLLVEVARIFRCDSMYQSLNVACALELLHTYTLIHDDLPLFDNDNTRRGKPTCHIVFGEQVALLAGNALMSLAIETICQVNSISANKRNEICTLFARCFGAGGVLRGQLNDLSIKNESTATDHMIDALLYDKTAMPFVLACESGALLGSFIDSELSAIREYALNVGRAYQLVDDLTDQSEESTNIVALRGNDWVVNYALRSLLKARDALSQLSHSDIMSMFIDVLFDAAKIHQ